MTATRVRKSPRTPEAVKAYRKKLRKGMIEVGKDIWKEVRKDISRKVPTQIRGRKEYATERAVDGAPPRRVTGDLWRSVKRRTKSRRGRISLFIETIYYGRFLERKRGRRQGADHPFIGPVIERREKQILETLKRAGRA